MFHGFDDINWSRVLVVLGAAFAFWLGLKEVLPDNVFQYGSVILGAISAAIGVLINGKKEAK